MKTINKKELLEQCKDYADCLESLSLFNDLFDETVKRDTEAFITSMVSQAVTYGALIAFFIEEEEYEYAGMIKVEQENDFNTVKKFLLANLNEIEYLEALAFFEASIQSVLNDIDIYIYLDTIVTFKTK